MQYRPTLREWQSWLVYAAPYWLVDILLHWHPQHQVRPPTWGRGRVVRGTTLQPGPDGTILVGSEWLKRLVEQDVWLAVGLHWWLGRRRNRSRKTETAEAYVPLRVRDDGGLTSHFTRQQWKGRLVRAHPVYAFQHHQDCYSAAHMWYMMTNREEAVVAICQVRCSGHVVSWQDRLAADQLELVRIEAVLGGYGDALDLLRQRYQVPVCEPPDEKRREKKVESSNQMENNTMPKLSWLGGGLPLYFHRGRLSWTRGVRLLSRWRNSLRCPERPRLRLPRRAS